MPIDLLSDLIEPELDRLPRKFRHFLSKGQPGSAKEQEQSYFAYAYTRGFEELIKTTLEFWPRCDYLRLPVLYLCRHSIELTIKDAIAFVSVRSSLAPKLDGHELFDLWRHFQNQITNAGYSVDDEYAALCTKLVKHLHDSDSDGERFRHPSSKSGNPFGVTRVELEGLYRAHWNICTYCEGTMAMFEEGI